MTNSTPTGASTSGGDREAAHSTPDAATLHGSTTIDDVAVSQVVGIAVRTVPGVHDLGGRAARAIGAIRTRLNAADEGQGATVEVGEHQAAVDVALVADYPIALDQLARDVRSAVIDAVERLVGLEVTEVNVTIVDIHILSEDDRREPRVQ